eukprot:CAMPEP_0174907262 /NCGR_PEP_ID=MMETSP0167-20121228/60081_1 /TAXON_ID=38298 /ORGANISM="Rhodella maculata, Strain CCMP736" /LENGTH=43 /DNA_ID= /DNA_START= /DNA_END= /DNA_ORIENTATION=
MKFRRPNASLRRSGPSPLRKSKAHSGAAAMPPPGGDMAAALYH